MNKQKIANALSKRPHVVGTAHSLPTLESALRLRTGAVDFLELRLDGLLDHLDRVEAALPRLKAPVILTIRLFAEGGARKLHPGRRRELFEQFLPSAAIVDIELRAIDQMLPVLSEAARRGVTVIASHHNFHTTPPRARLQELARRAMHAGADIFKVATATERASDVAVLLGFVAEQKRIPLSVMGMGKYGRASRLLLAQAGSVLNYGYLGASAPVAGQWPATQLRQRIEELE